MIRSARATPDDVLRDGRAAVRCRPWPDDPTVAQLLPVPVAAPPTGESVRRWLDQLADLGWRGVRTGALPPRERAPWRAAGLDTLEELYLLRHDLTATVPRPTHPVRRAHKTEWDTIVAVDGAAFDHGWRLDRAGIEDACHATPHHRLRVTGEPVVGYAVFGRSGGSGFLQRLAVEPAHAGRGLGSALVHDGLRWLQRRGAVEALVNTQVGNDRALELYRHLGFRLLPDRLAVLGRPLERS